MSAMYALSSPVMRATLVSTSPVERVVRFPPCAQSHTMPPALPRTSTQTTARPASRPTRGRAATWVALAIATSVTTDIRPG